MRWWKNLKITVKIAVGFFIVALISGAVAGLTGYLGVENIRRQSNEAYDSIVTPVNLVANVSDLYQQSRVEIRTAMLRQDQKTVNEEVMSLGETLSAIRDKYFSLTSVIRDSEALGVLDEFKHQFDSYAASVDAISQRMRKGIKTDFTDALLRKDIEDNEAKVSTVLGKLQTKLLMLDIEANRQNQATARRTAFQIALFATLAVALALVLGILIARSVGRPLKKVLESANRLARGDMSIHLDAPTGGNEIGILASAFERMTAAIRAMNRDVEYLVEALAAGDLSARADASKHSGDFRQIIEGFNGAVESLVTPIDEVTTVLDKVSRYDLAQEVQGGYKGKMSVLASAANDIRTRLLSLQKIFLALSAGDMSSLAELEKIGRRSENDLMIPAVIKMMRTLNSLLGEANAISGEACRGNLEVRGDADRYEGLYSRLIAGINGVAEAAAKPLNDASTALEAMARNDFTASMPDGTLGAYASLSASINRVAETLSRTVWDIDSTAEQVAAGTRQVSEGSQTLSRGAADQALAIEQITVSVSEIANKATKTAERATHASSVASAVREKAAHGMVRMKELQQAMTDIDDASTNISRIIQVIDDIAFQTNLLALNAAVEAARAGQHGRGFAVVAEEVRSLAKRSADAATETTQLIEESIRKGKAGTHCAHETASELHKIVDGIEQATAIVGSIAQDSSEQAAAVVQANRNIAQVSSVTQANSAAAQQSAAASEELQNQALQLKEMVGKFKIRKTGRAQ